MLDWLLHFPIYNRRFLVAIDLAGVVAFLFLLTYRPSRRKALTRALVFGIGVFVGYFVCWLLGDVLDVFGVVLTGIIRMWVALGFGGICVAIMSLGKTTWWRRGVAILCIPLFVVISADGINIDVGAYRDVSDAFGISPYSQLKFFHEHGDSGPLSQSVSASWRAPADMKKLGEVGMVNIPGLVSHFPGRPATVYLPPAALTSHPPVLPVVVLLSGQPGATIDFFTVGKLEVFLDRFAASVAFLKLVDGSLS